MADKSKSHVFTIDSAKRPKNIYVQNEIKIEEVGTAEQYIHETNELSIEYDAQYKADEETPANLEIEEEESVEQFIDENGVCAQWDGNSADELIHNGHNTLCISRRDPPNSKKETETKETILTWQYDMVISLIKSMEVHHENLSHPKKRRKAFENICKDMLSHGFSVNNVMVKNKWKSLVRSYKVTKDNKNRTGRVASRFMFFDEMDAILGNKCSFSSESGRIIDEDNSSHFEPSLVTDLGQGPSTSTGLSYFSNHPSAIRPAPSSETSRKRKRKWKSIEEENKMIRHRERMEIERQKIKLEEKKIKLLEKYLHNLNN